MCCPQAIFEHRNLVADCPSRTELMKARKEHAARLRAAGASAFREFDCMLMGLYVSQLLPLHGICLDPGPIDALCIICGVMAAVAVRNC